MAAAGSTQPSWPSLSSSSSLIVAYPLTEAPSDGHNHVPLTTRITSMPMLHDPTVRSSIEARLNAIRADSPRQWGRMSVDQMLWHVNQFLSASIGEGTLETQKSSIPAPIMKFFLLWMPWPKSAPTNKSALAKGRYDLEAERARCKELIAKFVSRPVDGEWPVDPSFGPVSGKFASKLQAKHLDHHFRQFNA